MRLPAITSSSHRRVLITRLVGYGLFQGALAVTIALFVRDGFSILSQPASWPVWEPVAYLGAGLLAIALLSSWIRRAEYVGRERLGQSYVHDLRLRLFNHLTRISAPNLAGLSQGAILLRFVGDLSAIRRWISLGVAQLIVSGIVLTGALSVLLVMEPAIGMAVTVAVLVSAGLTFYLGPKLHLATKRARRRRARLAARLNDRIANLTVIEAFGQSRRERRNVRKLSQLLRRAMIKRAAAAGWIRAISEGTSVLAQASALCIGAVLVGLGRAEPGAIIAALVVVGLLSPRLKELARVFEYWTAARIAQDKIQEFFAIPARQQGRKMKVNADASPGRIEFRRTARGDSVRRISATAEAGERVAIVGPNGAGKTTLLSLAAGLLEPTNGRVLLDGQDIDGIRSSSLREVFAVVGPDFSLLRGSVRMNLTYGARFRSSRERRDIMELCGIPELLERLPEGDRTRIVEGGRNLSTGERARIALCRALMRRPRVLLLDEADARLDQEAMRIIEIILKNFDGTILFVTHNRRLLNMAQTVWYLEGGKLVETGSPAELLSGDGATAKLFQPRIIEAA